MPMDRPNRGGGGFNSATPSRPQTPGVPAGAFANTEEQKRQALRLMELQSLGFDVSQLGTPAATSMSTVYNIPGRNVPMFSGVGAHGYPTGANKVAALNVYDYASKNNMNPSLTSAIQAGKSPQQWYNENSQLQKNLASIEQEAALRDAEIQAAYKPSVMQTALEGIGQGFSSASATANTLARPYQALGRIVTGGSKGVNDFTGNVGYGLKEGGKSAVRRNNAIGGGIINWFKT